MNKKGLFIAFEGLDGSGKTTQLERVEAELLRRGYAVVSSHEPNDDNPTGKIVNLMLEHKMPRPEPLEFQRL